MKKKFIYSVIFTLLIVFSFTFIYRAFTANFVPCICLPDGKECVGCDDFCPMPGVIPRCGYIPDSNCTGLCLYNNGDGCGADNCDCLLENCQGIIICVIDDCKADGCTCPISCRRKGTNCKGVAYKCGVEGCESGDYCPCSIYCSTLIPDCEKKQADCDNCCILNCGKPAYFQDPCCPACVLGSKAACLAACWEIIFGFPDGAIEDIELKHTCCSHGGCTYCGQCEGEE